MKSNSKIGVINLSVGDFHKQSHNQLQTIMNVDLNQLLSNPVLAVLGGLVVFKFFFSLVNLFYARIFRPGKNLKKVYGEWGELFLVYKI